MVMNGQSSHDERQPEEPNEPSAADPLQVISAQLAELTSIVTHLIDVKIEQVREQTRRFIVGTAIALVIGGIAVAAMLRGMLYAFEGFRLLLRNQFADSPGLAELIVGVGICLAVVIVTAVVAFARARDRRARLIKKYGGFDDEATTKQESTELSTKQADGLETRFDR